jgi:ribosome-associated protein
MDIRKLQRITVEALEDVKAKDIEVINTTKLTSLFDRIIVASGDSNRQVKALARSVHDKVKEAGGTVIGMEGEDSGEWVLVDLGDIVVHVMQPAVRTYYNIEELWTGSSTRPKGKLQHASAQPVASDEAEEAAPVVNAKRARPAAKVMPAKTAKPKKPV